MSATSSGIVTALHLLMPRAKAIAADDDSALFEQLVRKHQERLYRVAYRMTGEYEEANDLMQDAIIEAYRAFQHFQKGTYFDKWLYRIMSRTFIDRKRSMRRTKTVSLDEPVSGDGSGAGSAYALERQTADPISDPAYRLDRLTLDHRVQDGLDKLTADYRLVIILSDIEDLSYEEVAGILQCPIGTVRSRLHRARAQMRQHLLSAGYK